MHKTASLLVAFILCVSAVWASEVLRQNLLPAPRKAGGKPLMTALNERQSRREIDPAKPIPGQILSDLLWSAFGVNRSESGKRTAPSARNRKEIDIYLATAEGLFRFDADAHALNEVLKTDVRPKAGRQKFIWTAPAVLIYVADYARMGDMPEVDKNFYAATDTGFISQNVYLFCASENLATVVIGMLDRAELAVAMQLGPDQKVILTQPVGYPAR